MKLGSHNSATGEKGYGFISKLVSIFAKCQSKTIKEQLDFGVNYFDIRIKYVHIDKHIRELVCAHGIWRTEKSVYSILNEINKANNKYVNVTYEGNIDSKTMTVIYNNFKSLYPNINFIGANIKKPNWTNIESSNTIELINKYIKLDKSTWHTYIPIPWLWKKIYYNKVEVDNINDGKIVVTDFV